PAVVGEALAGDRRGRLRGSRFVTPRAGVRPAGTLVPPPAVFWRRSFLEEHRDLLGHCLWTNVLLSLAGRAGITVPRTFAVVDVRHEARHGLAGLIRQWLDGRRLRRRVPGLGLGSLLRARLVSSAGLLRGRARAALRVLPHGVEARLRTLYVRRV